MLTWQSLVLNNTYDVENCVRNYNPLAFRVAPLTAGKCRRLPYHLDHGVTCPYGEDLCIARPDASVAPNSGFVTFTVLGFNSEWMKELSVERRSVCAVALDKPFLEEDEAFSRVRQIHWPCPDRLHVIPGRQLPQRHCLQGD